MALAGIVTGSFLYYAPCYFSGFDSDHAIHVLMAIDFSLPHDIYYWGQNRLGSLLPMVTSVFIKLFDNVHPLYLISMVQWIFLLIPTILISRYIKQQWLRVAFFVFIFFPFNEYFILLLPGHPYSAQYLCGTLSVYFLNLYYKESAGVTKRTAFFILGLLFYILGAWSSEFNLILLLIPAVYLLKERGLRGAIKYVVPGLVLFASAIVFIKLLKANSPTDQFYDQTFFNDRNSLSKQFSNLATRFKETFLFGDGLLSRNLNYFVLIILFVFTWRRGRKTSLHISKLVQPLVITAIVAFICLFFSTWNLRSDIAAKYYIPVYVMLLCAWMLYADAIHVRKLSIAVCATFILISVVSLFEDKYVIKEHPGGPIKNFNEFQALPQGTLIGHYWDVYLVNSVATKNLKAITYQDQIGRNHDRAADLMRANRFYFLNNEEFKARCKNDTITQFGTTLVFTGKKIRCNNEEVLVFAKVR
jgi:hypothetical protein